MKHLREITTTRPATAQFEGALQLVAFLSALINLIENGLDLVARFGFEKDGTS